MASGCIAVRTPEWISLRGNGRYVMLSRWQRWIGCCWQTTACLVRFLIWNPYFVRNLPRTATAEGLPTPMTWLGICNHTFFAFVATSHAAKLFAKPLQWISHD